MSQGTTMGYLLLGGLETTGGPEDHKVAKDHRSLRILAEPRDYNGSWGLQSGLKTAMGAPRTRGGGLGTTRGSRDHRRDRGHYGAQDTKGAQKSQWGPWTIMESRNHNEACMKTL